MSDLTKSPKQQRPTFLEQRLRKSHLLASFFDPHPISHNGSPVSGALTSDKGAHVEITGPRWAYGMAFKRNLFADYEFKNLIIEGELAGNSGKIGIACGK